MLRIKENRGLRPKSVFNKFIQTMDKATKSTRKLLK
jgi:hypothetical protein